MKVKHVLMIAAVLLAMLAVPVSADTVVTHSVTQGYEVFIPPTLTVDTPGEIKITGLIDTKTQVRVSVTSANDWSLDLSNDELSYSLKDDAGTDLNTQNVLIVTAGTTGEQNVTATLADGASPMYRGNYVDTLTFTVTQEAIDGSVLIHSYDELKAFIAGAPTDGTAAKALLLSDIEVPQNETIIIGSGKTITLDLNSHTLSSTNTRTATHNFLIDVNGGTLTVKDGQIAYKHTGTNMGWNGATTVIDVTAGGVLNMDSVTVKFLGGTDMNFAVHLNNWGSVTLNAENCVFEGTYCAVRLFNSGPDMNTVTIKNSVLNGGSSRCFWVHNYVSADFGGKTYSASSVDYDKSVIDARLNLNIFDNGNTFTTTGTPTSPIRYGYATGVFFDESGNQVA